MVAIGLGWMKKQDVISLIEPGSIFTPHLDLVKREHYRMWHKAVERSKNWVD
jgi:glycerol kinase